MLLIRLFEEQVLLGFSPDNRNKIFGTTHAYIGQEAVAVGVCAALGKDDYITSTHRGHGHFLAKGGDPARIMAELFGKETGYSRGRGGSQHMGDLSIGHLGANGITAGGLPVATGAGLSIKYRGSEQVAACFFGDGAASEGMFHESLNMASLWKLPVVYVCENNRYAMSTPVAKAVSVPDIAARASSYGMEGVIVDGMDVVAVAAAAHSAVAKARAGGGPTLLECKTYRFAGHSKSDPCVYRTREEEDAWKARDPLLLVTAALAASGAEAAELEAATLAVRDRVDGALRFAADSPWPLVGAP
jgi:TPP-dependent pyruvate/acetoin dehydrogenase alpha subunit